MSASAMVQMSRAIRHVLEDNGGVPNVGLKGIKTETLADLTQITGAFYLDLKDELSRREKEEDK